VSEVTKVARASLQYADMTSSISYSP